MCISSHISFRSNSRIYNAIGRVMPDGDESIMQEQTFRNGGITCMRTLKAGDGGHVLPNNCVRYSPNKYLLLLTGR